MISHHGCWSVSFECTVDMVQLDIDCADLYIELNLYRRRREDKRKEKGSGVVLQWKEK